jgi:uncharacterized protein YjbI with pentapeptide repeats
MEGDRDAAISPRRAPVAPRVRPLGGGESLPLEDRAIGLIRARTHGVVQLLGPVGSGKTTALKHLAAVLPPDADVGFHDPPDAPGLLPPRRLVFSTVPYPRQPVASFVMSRWEDDDLIEYLLTVHRPQCQSVMFKVKNYTQHLSLGGSPELWRMVLDTLANHESIPDVSAGLRHCLVSHLSDPKMFAGTACLSYLQHGNWNDSRTIIQALDPAARRLLMHRAVQLLLTSELIVRNLCDGVDWSMLGNELPRDLIVETARLAAHWPAVVKRLDEMVRSNKRRVHPMAVSLLLALQPQWRPGKGQAPSLTGAYVAGAHWAGVDLHNGALSGADLERADLSNADLSGAKASAATLCSASLRGAKLDNFYALGTNLAKAHLAGASADGAKLRGADLHGADLRSARLHGADLTNANLTDAILTSASLCDAVLDHTNLAGTDLVGADFSRAFLSHVSLCDANMAGTSFYRADLRSCELEGLSLPNGNFAGAKLNGCYLSGSIMSHADFHSADLRNTGLADVEWEGANLRDADLSGATFHMGSTRSGLVGSVIPCEGSKTGFYTDDFQDRDFKSPEEIRKANLCRADLRGAKLEGVDFYLVDLRGAHYTDKQAKYFRRCGAILD